VLGRGAGDCFQVHLTLDIEGMRAKETQMGEKIYMVSCMDELFGREGMLHTSIPHIHPP
jgi:hypothetical protein